MAATYEGVELTPWTPSYKALPKPPKEPKKRGRRTNAEKGLPPAAPKRTPDETRAENRIIFRKALTDWKLGGVPVLDSFEEVGENAYFCQLADRKRVIPSDAIRALIAQLPGQIWPFKDNKGLVWSRGGCNGPHGWILTRRDGLQYLLETQKLMQELIPADVWSGRPLPFTYGGIAKTFMRWTTIPAEPCWMHTENRLLHPGGIAHRRSVPGRHPGVVMYDADSYYFHLLKRLPTPIPVVSDNRIFWPLLEPEQQARWDAMLDFMAPNKQLRNSLWGALLGSKQDGTAFTRDKHSGEGRSFVNHRKIGRLRPAALLVARTGHELTQLESLAGQSVFSYTDCVTFTDGQVPTVWPKFGIPWGVRAYGDAHILDSKSYKIGEYKAPGHRSTLDYGMKSGFGLGSAEDGRETPQEPILGTAFPDVQLHALWL